VTSGKKRRGGEKSFCRDRAESLSERDATLLGTAGGEKKKEKERSGKRGRRRLHSLCKPNPVEAG